MIQEIKRGQKNYNFTSSKKNLKKLGLLHKKFFSLDFLLNMMLKDLSE